MPIIAIAKLIGEVIKLTVETTTEAVKLAKEIDDLDNANSNTGTSKRYVKTEHYEGTIIGKKIDGHGTLKLNSGYYTGDFVNGKYDGLGTFYWSSGYRYQGSWKEGKRNGYGTLYNPENIPIYVGEWQNDSRCGQGTSFLPTGALQYIGQWNDDKRHGNGKNYWPDGFVSLDGQWVNGFIVKGKMHYSPQMHAKQYGNVFEGTFKDWKFDQGVLTKKDGTRYEGTFVESKYEGEGTLTYPETDQYGRIQYKGSFSKGLKNGFGKEINKKGDEYEGPFENNARHGNGVLKFGSSGNIYEGPFDGGNMSGKGVLKLKSGSRYEATWVKSLMEGEALLITKDGKTETHIYKGGARIDNKKE